MTRRLWDFVFVSAVVSGSIALIALGIFMALLVLPLWLQVIPLAIDFAFGWFACWFWDKSRPAPDKVLKCLRCGHVGRIPMSKFGIYSLNSLGWYIEADTEGIMRPVCKNCWGK